jgi:CRP-like cAMP-binding protein
LYATEADTPRHSIPYPEAPEGVLSNDKELIFVLRVGRAMPQNSKSRVHDLLVKTVSNHARLQTGDEAALRSLPFELDALKSDEDVVCQGERPDVAVFILSGFLGRYHTMSSGDRQYLSLHIASDMPDVQSLHLKIMDHSVCALDEAEIATFRHDKLLPLLAKRPSLAGAFWRITLVDAAIFRQAITNNSARPHVQRMAHFCCEQFYRQREAGLVTRDACALPLNQAQLGQTLGMSHISANRALKLLRTEELADIRGGVLTVYQWRALTRRAGFDSSYLHIDKDT